MIVYELVAENRSSSKMQPHLKYLNWMEILDILKLCRENIIDEKCIKNNGIVNIYFW